MTLILICGYKKTGKDYLCSVLSKIAPRRYGYQILAHPASGLDGEFTSGKYIHTSFAADLKRQVSEIYGIPLNVPDEEKDVKQYFHPKTNEIVSARDLYKEWGTIKKNEDEEYWCKAWLNLLGPIDHNATYTITDWRFSYEHPFVLKLFDTVIRIRVYRSNVDAPPKEDLTERSLDGVFTDYVAIPEDDEDEFEKLVQTFPQYSEFVKVSTI